MDTTTIAIIAALLGGIWLLNRNISAGGAFNIQAPTTIAGWASSAGFSGQDLVIAVAVAYAESSGDPNAYNPESQVGTPQGQGSYGLWQIYLYKHPEFQGQDLFDPQTNANAAYSVYRQAGNQFTPWSTFNGGQYTTYLSQAQQEVLA